MLKNQSGKKVLRLERLNFFRCCHLFDNIEMHQAVFVKLVPDEFRNIQFQGNPVQIGNPARRRVLKKLVSQPSDKFNNNHVNTPAGNY